MKKISEKLKETKIAVVAHIFSSGPALDLEDFLKNRVNTLFFIGHPFSYRKETNSFYRHYNSGILKKEHKAFGWKFPDPLMYLKDFFYTILWVISHGRFNYYIGSDNFDAFVGLLLKRIGMVDEVVLYTIDYMPQRFSSRLLNFLYRFFDHQCLDNCKIIWNVSSNMADAREEFAGLKKEEHIRQLLVPLGMWFDRIPKVAFEKKKRFQLVFLGHLLEKQGLDLVIEAMPKILKKIPQVKLIIIGTGPYEDILKDLVKKLKVEKVVSFTGYIEKHQDIEKMLAESALAVAMYKPDPNSFTYFADPAKIKNYLAAGLPVILSNVPVIAKELEKKKCGVIAAYKKEDFTNVVINLLGSDKRLKDYSGRAVTFAKEFDWNKVFTEALEKTI